VARLRFVQTPAAPSYPMQHHRTRSFPPCRVGASISVNMVTSATGAEAVSISCQPHAATVRTRPEPPRGQIHSQTGSVDQQPWQDHTCAAVRAPPISTRNSFDRPSAGSATTTSRPRRCTTRALPLPRTQHLSRQLVSSLVRSPFPRLDNPGTTINSAGVNTLICPIDWGNSSLEHLVGSSQSHNASTPMPATSWPRTRSEQVDASPDSVPVDRRVGTTTGSETRFIDERPVARAGMCRSVQTGAFLRRWINDEETHGNRRACGGSTPSGTQRDRSDRRQVLEPLLAPPEPARARQCRKSRPVTNHLRTP
jgi:hypothetical protein